MKRPYLKKQSGQALLEYIFLLFIAVLMVLGLVYQFNDAFRQYLNAWFSDQGGYLFCLIENGYLPGESETCPLPHFDLKNGKPLSAQGITGSTPAGSTSSGGRLVGGGGRASDRGRGLIPYGPQNGSGGTSANAGVGGGAAKISGDTGDLGFSSPNTIATNGANGLNGNGGGRGRYVPIQDTQENQGPAKKKNVPITERDMKSARLIAAEKERKRRAELEGPDANLTFGKLLKYLFLIVISFSIIFFIGSQLLAISQGSRKRR